jgi:hypothetical protein
VLRVATTSCAYVAVWPPLYARVADQAATPLQPPVGGGVEVEVGGLVVVVVDDLRFNKRLEARLTRRGTGDLRGRSGGALAHVVANVLVLRAGVVEMVLALIKASERRRGGADKRSRAGFVGGTSQRVSNCPPRTGGVLHTAPRTWCHLRPRISFAQLDPDIQNSPRPRELAYWTFLVTMFGVS